MDESTSTLDSIKEISFGSAAGVAGKLFEYPFDTVKVRLQSQPDGVPLRFKGPLDCFEQTWRKEGIYGFFRGISSPLVGAAAENSSLFFSYRLAQKTARYLFYPTLAPQTDLPMSSLLVCGAVSGSFTSFILTPIELIKCQMQVTNLRLYDHSSRPTSATPRSPSSLSLKHHSSNVVPVRALSYSSATAPPPGALTLISQVYRDHGLAGFWRGQLGTFFRETGGGAAWFGAYEYVSGFLRRRRRPLSSTSSTPQTSTTSMTDSMLAGAVAGVSYNLSLFPADSIKSRMQTDAVLIGSSTSKTSAAVYRGFWSVGKEMYRAGGVAVFYRGCGMTVLRSAPSSAIIFLTYEYLKKTWG